MKETKIKDKIPIATKSRRFFALLSVMNATTVNGIEINKYKIAPSAPGLPMAGSKIP